MASGNRTNRPRLAFLCAIRRLDVDWRTVRPQPGWYGIAVMAWPLAIAFTIVGLNFNINEPGTSLGLLVLASVCIWFLARLHTAKLRLSPDAIKRGRKSLTLHGTQYSEHPTRPLFFLRGHGRTLHVRLGLMLPADAAAIANLIRARCQRSEATPPIRLGSRRVVWWAIGLVLLSYGALDFAERVTIGNPYGPRWMGFSTIVLSMVVGLSLVLAAWLRPRVLVQDDALHVRPLVGRKLQLLRTDILDSRIDVNAWPGQKWYSWLVPVGLVGLSETVRLTLRGRDGRTHVFLAPPSDPQAIAALARWLGATTDGNSQAIPAAVTPQAASN